MTYKTSREIVGRFDENFKSRSKQMDTQLNSENWISEKEHTYELLLAQLLGFSLASKGYPITELVSSAGATYEEFQALKKESDFENLKDFEKVELEEYFKAEQTNKR